MNLRSTIHGSLAPSSGSPGFHVQCDWMIENPLLMNSFPDEVVRSESVWVFSRTSDCRETAKTHGLKPRFTTSSFANFRRNSRSRRISKSTPRSRWTANGFPCIAILEMTSKRLLLDSCHSFNSWSNSLVSARRKINDSVARKDDFEVTDPGRAKGDASHQRKRTGKAADEKTVVAEFRIKNGYGGPRHRTPNASKIFNIFLKNGKLILTKIVRRLL